MDSIVQVGEKSVERQERERPEPTSAEVLVKVHTAGLCGSDVASYLMKEGYEAFTIPRVIGHEYSGEIVQVGDDVEAFSAGDRVVENPVHECRNCNYCLTGKTNICENREIVGVHTDGAFTEYRVVDPRYLYKIPESISTELAATIEPLSVAARAALSRSALSPASDVLVMGPGPIGAFIALIANSIGAEVVVSGTTADATHRLPLIRDTGISTVNVDEADPTDVSDATIRENGFDIVFDATGHRSGLETGAECVRRDGEIVVVGLAGSPSELFMRPLVREEVDIVTSYGYTDENFKQAFRLMGSGMVDQSTLTQSYELVDAEQAIRDHMNGEVCKAVFRIAP